MKTHQIVFPILLIVLLISSCKKYLDIKTSSSQVTAQTPQDCQRLLDDYTTMNTGYPSDGESSADDYYLNDDSYLNYTSQEDKDTYLWSPTAIRASANPQWQNAYKVVFNANLVLETLKKLQGGSTDPTTLNTLKGSALFFRSYAYWQVAQLYTKPYTAATASQDPGIPLRNSTDITEISTRGTLQQTYDRIIQDLQEALSLLPATSTVPTRPNKAAAYAMLARVYLAKQDYPDALNAATSTLQLNSQLIDYNTLNPNAFIVFQPRFNKEVIFHSIMARQQMLQPGSTYACIARIDSTLIKSYTSNDLRSQIFFKPNSDPNTGEPDGTFRFVGNYEPTFNYADFFDGLAVDEIYLIRAECYARANKPTEAMTDLNTLLSNRWKKDDQGNSTYVNQTAASGAAALDKILPERRKELVMRGLRWTDLRRLNKDSRYAVTLKRTVEGVEYTLPPNDPRYTLLIPQEVITNSGIAQNSR